jgi:hypothetical protein
MLRPNGNNGEQKDSYRLEYLQARRELLSLTQQDESSVSEESDVLWFNGEKYKGKIIDGELHLIPIIDSPKTEKQ